MLKLANGILIPKVGFGTFPMNRFKLLKAVLIALKCGYKRFDTASAYGNERWLGFALKLSLKKRTDYFITTKLSNYEQKNCSVEVALKRSMKKLGVKYIDLYLMYWPNPETYLEKWKEMEELYKKGLVKAIGVCNFHEHHLERLISNSEIVPVLNQIELTPLLNQKKLEEYCKEKNIVIEAYSPLARMHEKIRENKVLNDLAKDKNRTISQIILKWNLEKERCFSVKSESKKRIKENIDIYDFYLKKDEILDIDKIDSNFRVRHNPDDCDFSKL